MLRHAALHSFKTDRRKDEVLSLGRKTNEFNRLKIVTFPSFFFIGYHRLPSVTSVLAGLHRLHRFISIHISSHRFTSVHVGSRRFTSVHVASRRFTLVHIGPHRFTSFHKTTTKIFSVENKLSLVKLVF